MKHSPLPFVFLIVCALASPALSEDATQGKAKAAQPEKSGKPVGWTVTGKWIAKHPHWEGELELRPDGVVAGASAARWILSADRDRPMLVIFWDEWGTESLDLVADNRFEGRTRWGLFTLHRQGTEAHEKVTASASTEPETRTWTQGQPPIRLIKKDEGICTMVNVTGPLAADESVSVAVGNDGFWYLGGKASQKGVSGICNIIRYNSLTASVTGNADLTGRWYAAGSPSRGCEIHLDGDKLVGSNEFGDAWPLRKDAADTVTAEGWNGQNTGLIHGDTIFWADGTYWTRQPLRKE